MNKVRTLIFILSASFVSAAVLAVPKRSKVIDFENEVVESMSKRPLNSLSQVERDRNRKAPHLYRKRSGFSTETRETLAQSRYMP